METKYIIDFIPSEMSYYFHKKSKLYREISNNCSKNHCKWSMVSMKFSQTRLKKVKYRGLTLYEVEVELFFHRINQTSLLTYRTYKNLKGYLKERFGGRLLNGIKNR
jgi:hypothetical protein